MRDRMTLKNLRPWVRSHLPLRVSSGNGFEFEGMWTDCRAMFRGDCPKGYRRNLESSGQWLKEPYESAPAVFAKSVEGTDTPVKPVQTAEGHTCGRPDPIDVLESEDGQVRVHVNGRYIGYALRRFKGAQFFASSEKWRPRVSVHHKGEVVGVIMGILVD